jgi:acetolactate synthase-1/2/3 large subunit
VVTIIFANRAYAILQAEMRNVGVTAIGANVRRMLELEQPSLDWISIARGMGVEAARAESCEEFSDLLDSVLLRHGPFLIEAVI